jgi:hypothetical protein
MTQATYFVPFGFVRSVTVPKLVSRPGGVVGDRSGDDVMSCSPFVTFGDIRLEDVLLLLMLHMDWEDVNIDTSLCEQRCGLRSSDD